MQYSPHIFAAANLSAKKTLIINVMPKLKKITAKGKTATGRFVKKLEYSPKEKSELEALGEGIRELIVHSGSSIERFAYENELGKATVSDLINGKVDVKYCTLRTVAKGLGFKNVTTLLTKIFK